MKALFRLHIPENPKVSFMPDKQIGNLSLRESI